MFLTFDLYDNLSSRFVTWKMWTLLASILENPSWLLPVRPSPTLNTTSCVPLPSRSSVIWEWSANATFSTPSTRNLRRLAFVFSLIFKCNSTVSLRLKSQHVIKSLTFQEDLTLIYPPHFDNFQC